LTKLEKIDSPQLFEMLSIHAVLADFEGHQGMDDARYLEDGKLTVFRRSGTYYARICTAASCKYLCVR
jgi:hypothetical protein